MDGLRACLSEEFTSVYVFNLRGNQRTSGELSRQEGGKIFGSGSRAPIAITVLVKNPAKTAPATLRYYDIGDYHTRDEKLQIISGFAGIAGIDSAGKWSTLQPNAEHDWISQRDPAFGQFLPLGDKTASEAGAHLFAACSLGVSTNRDAWVYHFSARALSTNVSQLIDYYNEQVAAAFEIADIPPNAPILKKQEIIEPLLEKDPKRIAWSSSLLADACRKRMINFDENRLIVATYRPFVKSRLYFDGALNDRVGQMPRIFPSQQHENFVIATTGIGASKPFSALITNHVPNLHFHDTSQCFPLYLYEPIEEAGKLTYGNGDGEVIGGYHRRDAITDAILATFRGVYGPNVSKEDIFYYVYGVLHSPEYRTRFAADLKKMLPRIPLTREAKDFKAFSEAGRTLAEWHLNYETVEPWPVKEHSAALELDPDEHYRVQKMVFARPTADQKAAGQKWDKSRIIYNSHITLSDIPLAAYDYVVNGKPAIEWIIERYQVTRDKDSGIVNDPNDWCREHNQPRYIIDLVKRIVRVSIETMKIVRSLPPLNER